MVELKPMNKHIVIQAIKQDEKVGGGLLYAPSNALEKQHKTGKVLAIASCDEAADLKVGDLVLYDSIGSVDHRVGNQMFTTVKVMNVLAVIKDVVVQKFVEVPDPFEAAIVKDHG
jgi:co-chaperonin GroES (HSP10)